MGQRHGVRTYPTRQVAIGAHRVRLILVAPDRATGHRLRARLARTNRRDAVLDTPSGRAGAPAGPPAAFPPNPLSSREREVLGTMACGLPNKEIARLLSISGRTVDGHARAIYRKLEVANRTEAVSVALRRGLVALDLPAPPASDAA